VIPERAPGSFAGLWYTHGGVSAVTALGMLQLRSALSCLAGALVAAGCGGVVHESERRATGDGACEREADCPDGERCVSGECRAAGGAASVDAGVPEPPAAGGRAGAAGGTPPIATGGAVPAAGGSAPLGMGGTASGGAPPEPRICPRNPGTGGISGTALAGEDCCGGKGTCFFEQPPSEPPLPAGFTADTCAVSEGLACAPKSTASAPVCHIDFGTGPVEGRCLDRCFAPPEQGALFEAGHDCAVTAGPSTVCIPCYDPFWGNVTPICTGEGDAPGEPQPTRSPCGWYGGGLTRGRCVPGGVAGFLGFTSDFVPQTTCADGELCVPQSKLGFPTACFPACAGNLGEGACVPDYVIEHVMPGRVEFVGRADCNRGDSCAPCNDPLSGDMTGFCSR